MSKFPVIDGHIDTPSKLIEENRKFSERSDKGHCDLPRMKEGNVGAALFAVWPATTADFILKGLDMWFNLISNPTNELMQIKTVDDFKKAQSNGKIGAVLHIEGVGGIDDDFKLLRLGYHLGLRSIGLIWSNVNKFATGVRVRTVHHQRKTGLTDLGRELIAEAKSLGILIDVSHSNDPSFWDLYEITENPIIATHSNAREISNHPRNLTDDQIKAIYEKKGTIGINFNMGFLNPENPGRENPDLGFQSIKKHIDHIVELTDINTVAIGSDFDGAIMPNCLKDCTQFPALWRFLLDNGYSEQDIEKIANKNLLRVFKNTWK